MEELLSVREVAILLKVHEITVRRMLKTKTLTAFRVGRMYRFRRNDIEAYLQTTKEGHSSIPTGFISQPSLAQLLSEFIPSVHSERTSQTLNPIVQDLSSNKTYLKGLGEK